MPAAGRLLPYFFIAFALLGLWLGIREWLHPPFTDEQIRAVLDEMADEEIKLALLLRQFKQDYLNVLTDEQRKSLQKK